MKLWDWLFNRKPKAKRCRRGEIMPDQVMDDDEMVREGMARCFNSGKVVFGNRQDDGSIEWKESEAMK